MNPKSLTAEQRERAEDRFSRLPGVIACRIRTDASGGLLDVQVEVAAGADADAVSHEVESALKRDFGLAVDAGQIQVTAAGKGPDDVEEFPILEFAGRFAFGSVNVVSSRDGTRAEVELSREMVSAFGASSTENIATPAWGVVDLVGIVERQRADWRRQSAAG